MLKTPILHPHLLRALGAAGHGARILIADGNYPVSTASPASAEIVYLNLCPGCVGVLDVLEPLLQVVPVEAACVMAPGAALEPPIHGEMRRALGDIALQPLARGDFYALARQPDTALVVATAEQRRYANLLLTIGTVRLPGDTIPSTKL